MKKSIEDNDYYDEHIGCFGEFNIEDPVCNKLCVLSLRCAIEKDQNDRFEILEELVSTEAMITRIQ
jgi:hypothetical protein